MKHSQAGPGPASAEPLETRLHLAGPALADYYPIAVGSYWRYDVIDEADQPPIDLKVVVGTQVRRTTAERPRRVTYRYAGDDGTRVPTYQNLTSRGVLHFHALSVGNDVSLDFFPPIAFPADLGRGASRRTHGDVVVDIDGEHDFSSHGDFAAHVRVDGRRQVTVPAGTFSARRVRIDLDFEADDLVDLATTNTAECRASVLLWLAEGIGIVKAKQAYDLDVRFGSYRDEDERTLTQSLRTYSIKAAAAPPLSRARSQKVEREPGRALPDVLI